MASSRSCLVLLVVGFHCPSLASRGAPVLNGIFTNKVELSGWKHKVVFEEDNILHTGAQRTAAHPDIEDIDEVCDQLGGVIDSMCATKLPERYKNYRTQSNDHNWNVPIDLTKRKCDQDKMKVPSYCRVDSKPFHSCETKWQVVELQDTFVVGSKQGSGIGQSSGSIFNANGDVLFVDPYRNKGALPVIPGDSAAKLLQQATSNSFQDITHVDTLIYGMSSYAGQFYHQWAEVVPRVLLALDHAPSGTPVLLDSYEVVPLLNATRGLVLPKKKDGPITSGGFITTARDFGILRVQRLLVAWEVSRPVGSTDSFKSVSEQCSWIMGLPSLKLQKELHRWPAKESAISTTSHKPISILVIHREESPRRQVENQQALLDALRDVFQSPMYKIDVFIGIEHSIRESFRLFEEADLVISPHGAALVFVHAMRPGSAVLEIMFKDRRRNSHLTYDFFRLMAVKLGVRYDFSLATGSFDSMLICDPSNIAMKAKKLIRTLVR